MDELERQLRDELRGGVVDDVFVVRVGEQVEREERRRTVGVSLAAAAGLALIVLAGLGVGLAAAGLTGALAMPLPDRSALGVAAPVAGLLLLAAVAFPLARRR